MLLTTFIVLCEAGDGDTVVELHLCLTAVGFFGGAFFKIVDAGADAHGGGPSWRHGNTVFLAEMVNRIGSLSLQMPFFVLRWTARIPHSHRNHPPK